MGTKVAGVSLRTRVVVAAEVSPPADPGFGDWYRDQRRLRGISVYYVAGRTKLATDRIHAIEFGRDPLRPDGRGRAMARELAQAIGADPAEAMGRVMGTPAPRCGAAETAGVPRGRSWLRYGTQALLVSVLAGTGWLLASWLLEVGDGDASVGIVHRPDYVQRALDRAR